MKIVSFNVNSVRLRIPQLKALVQAHDPDVVGLQETKVVDEDFPVEALEELGFHCAFAGQKTHYGVAMLSKKPMEDVRIGFRSDDAQSQKDKLENEHSPKDNLLLIGDFNVAPVDEDLGIGADNVKRWLRQGATSFLPEERAWFEKLKQWGLDDSYRVKYPQQSDFFSWFDYRSKGFDRDPKRGLRIDHVLCTHSLTEKLVDSGIDYPIRAMEKPSDHCPVWSEFDI